MLVGKPADVLSLHGSGTVQMICSIDDLKDSPWIGGTESSISLCTNVMANLCDWSASEYIRIEVSVLWCTAPVFVEWKSVVVHG